MHLPPHTNRSVHVLVFACPADSRAMFGSGPAIGEPAFTSYLGLEGTDQLSRDGVLYLELRVGLESVTDGTSNTLMVGERPTERRRHLGLVVCRLGPISGRLRRDGPGRGEINTGHNGPNCPPGPYHFAAGRESDQCDAFHFWSLHLGRGANFLFADGSVRFLGYSADPLLPALAMRGGGEAVTVPD